jgi:glucokinase
MTKNHTEINDIKKYLGVDIGGTAVKLGIVNSLGEVLCSKTCTVNFDEYRTPILDSTERFIGEYFSEQLSSVSGIGVSATGQIDSTEGVVVGGCGFIPHWQGSRIKERFEEKFGLKTTVINDANAVAVAEHKFGAAKGSSDVIVVTVGTGIGGGIISAGSILQGHRGIGGEVGHFTIKSDGVDCSCGNRGCLEKYASMTALVSTVRQDKTLLAILGCDENEVNGKLIFSKLEDEKISACVDSWISCLASGLIGLTHIFNPEKILVGGGVSKQAYFISSLREKVLHGVMPMFAEGLTLDSAMLGNDAGMVGAVAYHINNE